MLEKFEYFFMPGGDGQYLDYDKVLLYFVLYSQSNNQEDEEVRQELLFNLLQVRGQIQKEGGNQAIKTIMILIRIACSLVPFLFKNVSRTFFLSFCLSRRLYFNYVICDWFYREFLLHHSDQKNLKGTSLIYKIVNLGCLTRTCLTCSTFTRATRAYSKRSLSKSSRRSFSSIAKAARSTKKISHTRRGSKMRNFYSFPSDNSELNSSFSITSSKTVSVQRRSTSVVQMMSDSNPTTLNSSD